MAIVLLFGVVSRPYTGGDCEVSMGSRRPVISSPGDAGVYVGLTLELEGAGLEDRKL